jgi:hypothetical protein
MLTRRAKHAVARRVLLVGGVIGALTLALWQQSELYRVARVDFASRQQDEPGWTHHRQEPLQDYIEYKTQGRLLEKTGQAWLDLYQELGPAGEHRFFSTGRPPLTELARAFDSGFTYVVLEHEGQAHYLGVNVSRPGDFPAAPASLRYPLRWLAPWVFLAGFLGYLLIPWPKREPDVVAYTRWVAASLPDLFVGMLLVGMFYALPWFVVPGQAHVSHPLVVEGGWMILTVVMWGFCLFGLAIYATAAWYEASCIRVADDHLVIESIRTMERIAFADIERVNLAVREPPKTLVKIGLLIGLLNWRAIGPTLLVAGRRDRMIELVLRDGRRRRFGLTGVYHLDRLISALRQAGVHVDPDLAS